MSEVEQKRPPKTLDDLDDSSTAAPTRFGLLKLLIFTNVGGVAMAYLLATDNSVAKLGKILFITANLSPLIALVYLVFFQLRIKNRRYAKHLSQRELKNIDAGNWTEF